MLQSGRIQQEGGRTSLRRLYLSFYFKHQRKYKEIAYSSSN